MNTTIIIIDYYLQSVEAGFSKKEAHERAERMLENYADETVVAEYDAISDILRRLENI